MCTRQWLAIFALLTTTCVPARVPAGEVAAPVSGLSAVWANEGGDKVWQQELRASSGRDVNNSVWSGRQIQLRAARNEVVSFVLQMESRAGVRRLSVNFDELRAPDGTRIGNDGSMRMADLWRYAGRNIEGFLLGYLPITGINRSNFGYEAYYDERHVPSALRRPLKSPTSREGMGGWKDRPMADMSVPDIAIPLELRREFGIAPGTTQGVWYDIYVPRDAKPGVYTGQVTIQEEGLAPRTIPVALRVHAFTLPDRPAARTVVYTSLSEILERYTGTNYAGINDPRTAVAARVLDNQFRLFRRHKITLVDANCDTSDLCPRDHPANHWIPKLSGEFYTRANGYDGPGEGRGDDLFVIGTYGSWRGQGVTDGPSMQNYLGAWEAWFRRNAPGTERMLYLIDESKDFGQINRYLDWTAWGRSGGAAPMPIMLTIPATDALAHAPRANVIASSYGVADTEPYLRAVLALREQAGRQLWQYNGTRPASGSFLLEDDGVALRMLPWAAHKLHIDRWFYWESTYYKDFQAGGGRQTNVFRSAVTYGDDREAHPVFGRVGYNRANGDGVLVYPGTDAVYPAESYNVEGPFASLRLKSWRRGVQDVDYLKLAEGIDPAAARRIVMALVPRVLWEVGVESHADPTYRYTDISWPVDPDRWEAARAQLAAIIEGRKLPPEPIGLRLD